MLTLARELINFTGQKIKFMELLSHERLVDHKRYILDAVNVGFKKVSQNVNSPHNGSDMLAYVNAVLEVYNRGVEGAVVECGSFVGSSAAKISLITERLGMQLHLFDSFEGMPENEEDHEKSIFGENIVDRFSEGTFKTPLDLTKKNIEMYGKIEAVSFHKGLFDETLPEFKDPIALLYIDVDLASSTRTVLEEIFPNVQKGGIIMSQDGDFPLVIDVFEDQELWAKLSAPGTEVVGLRRKKIVYINK